MCTDLAIAFRFQTSAQVISVGLATNQEAAAELFLAADDNSSKDVALM